MTLFRKTLLSLAAVAVLVLVVGGLAWSHLSSAEDAIEDAGEVHFPAARAVATLDEAQTDVARAYAALAHPRLPAEQRAALAADADRALARIDAAWPAFDKAVARLDVGTAWRDLAAPWQGWRRDAEALLALEREATRLAAAGVGHDEPRLAELDRRIVEAWLTAGRSYAVANPLIRKLDSAVAEDTARDTRAAHDATVRGNLVIHVVLALALLALAGVAVVLLRSIAKTIHGLVACAEDVTAAVGRGELSVRGDPARVSAEFQPVVVAMNRMVEAFQPALAMSSECVAKISNGEVPPAVAAEFQGEFAKVKAGWNELTDMLRRRSVDLDRLLTAAREGRLDERADPKQYKGYNGKMIEALNALMATIQQPMVEATRALERIAARDLTARMQGDYPGDYARIKTAVNGTAGALGEALAQVARSAQGVSAASAQIASGSQAVAAGASEQASSLEETSSSLEAMASMVKSSADNAQQASALAQTARAVAADGAAAMGDMEGAMEKIRASSEGTSQIIKDINEIAFQTNLLALNAAVEAARAGAAGRGFAVVAEEVRSLALRSKEAANKTEALIRESVKEAGEGDATAKLVAAKLGEITVTVGKVSDIVTEIAASAREQASGVEQITRAVGQMNHVTQQNAASSEESSSAAVELSSQAEELTSLVNGFQLGASGAGAAPQLLAPRAAAAPARGPAPHRASTPLAKPRLGGGGASGKPNGHGSNGHALRAEDVIPLDGDPVFKDF